jgi:hypothetical protein
LVGAPTVANFFFFFFDDDDEEDEDEDDEADKDEDEDDLASLFTVLLLPLPRTRCLNLENEPGLSAVVAGRLFDGDNGNGLRCCCCCAIRAAGEFTFFFLDDDDDDEGDQPPVNVLDFFAEEGDAGSGLLKRVGLEESGGNGAVFLLLLDEDFPVNFFAADHPDDEEEEEEVNVRGLFFEDFFDAGDAVVFETESVGNPFCCCCCDATKGFGPEPLAE